MKPDLERLLQTIPYGEGSYPFQYYLDFVSLSLEDLRGKRVLDIGSGLNRVFARNVNFAQVAEVISLEPRAEFESVNLTDLAPVVAAMADEMPFEDNSFDLVVSFLSVPMWIETADEMQAVFREIDRVLKPGGEARLYPPFHKIFWDEFLAGKIVLPTELESKSQGSRTAHITLIGLQNLGIGNLDLVERKTFGEREFITQPEYLKYRKP